VKYMVPVDARPGSARLIRETCRLAVAQGAPWLAVYPEAAGRFYYTRADERRLSANLRLAERLGADLVAFQPSERVLGRDLLLLAKQRGATHLVLAQRERPRWLDRLRGSLVEDLAEGVHDLEVVLLPPGKATPEPLPPLPAAEPLDARKLAKASLAVLLATAGGYLVFWLLGLADVIMVYMLGITVAATRFGRRTTLIVAAMSILALDFCFIEPRYRFVVTDVKHIGTFALMAGIGWVIVMLAERLRFQVSLAQDRERRTRTLYRLASVLAAGGSEEAIRQRAEACLREELEIPALVLLADGQGRLAERSRPDFQLNREEMELAGRVLAEGSPAGRGTAREREARFLALPLSGAERALGVAALLPGPGGGVDPERMDLVTSMAAQIALALERARLAEERAEARLLARHEQVRSALLSSVSHDLRTPLGTITGATSSLLDPGPEAAPEDQRVLLGTIHHEARRLLRMVNNLLDATRLESGPVRLRTEWAAAEEVVGSALARLEDLLDRRPVAVELPEQWVPMDPVLMEQALVNVLENAVKFSPPGSAIGIRGWVESGLFHLEVADRGPGIPPEERGRVFEKLYRGAGANGIPGAGLGLAVCRGVLEAHGGAIEALEAAGGGARIVMTLPLDGAPPLGPSPETLQRARP